MLSKILFYLFISSIVIQLYFLLSAYIRLIFYKKKESKTTLQPVSIIVCAYNELENLKKLLPKLYEQQHPDFEIIIVDDKSYDGTYEFLREESANNSLLKVATITETPDHINYKKYALLIGIKKAKNDIVLLTDADCLPASDEWVTSMTDSFEKETKIVLGYSQYKKETGFLNTFIRYETLHTGVQYIAAALAKNAYMGVGRNLAYRKSFFLEKDGFSGFEGVMGGDDDLFVNKYADRKNTKISIGKDSLVYSIPKTTFKEYYRQKLRHLSVGKLYRFGSKFRLGILLFAPLLFWFSFITLAIVEKEPAWLLWGFAIRLVYLILIYVPSSKKLGDSINIFGLLFMDFFYLIYQFIIGIPALFAKKVRWH